MEYKMKYGVLDIKKYFFLGVFLFFFCVFLFFLCFFVFFVGCVVCVCV